MRLLTTIFLSLTFIPSAVANVEKVIFVPSDSRPLQFTLNPNSLRLSPDGPRLYTVLDLNANTTGSERNGGGDGGGGRVGEEREESSTWVVLEKVIPGKRYEVRIVWAATEPAEFELGVFTAVEAVEAGMGAGAEGSVIRGGEEGGKDGEKEGGLKSSQGTVMYLRVLAKKDRYNPDPVAVELVLDPFIWNILPESLLHIGAIVVLVAGAAWWAGAMVDRWLSMVALQHRVLQEKKLD
ncbi:hypothetical protein EV426DRAFT_574480 [Tirmania nivea]|nr:hypothetical protein EV426DRAFT_574480 [Tirmania nivea]